MNKINILIISSADLNSTSGVIAYDLHKALLKNHNCEVLTLHSKVNEKGVISYNSSYKWFVKRVINKIAERFFSKKRIKTNRKYYFFDVDQNKSLVNINKVTRIINKPDLIIAYFMGGFFTIKDLYNLQAKYNNVPVFLVMADMVYITGGCHYAWDCIGFKEECQDCPAIIEKQHQHFASDNLKLNKQLIDKMDISIIAGSSQDYEYAKNSTLFMHKKVNFVLGGINLDTFYFQNKQATLKIKYGIKNDDFVILYGSVRVEEKRKGVQYFVDAINYLNKQKTEIKITIVTIGNGNFEDVLPNTKFNIINMGYMSDYKKLARVYNLADVFVTTTIQDSGPMMVNQSIACGTPVVCFDVGVARDIVINGETGFKVAPYNAEGIANSILKLYSLKNNEREIIHKNCFSLATENFSKEVAANNILKLLNKNYYTKKIEK